VIISLQPNFEVRARRTIWRLTGSLSAVVASPGQDLSPVQDVLREERGGLSPYS